MRSFLIWWILFQKGFVGFEIWKLIQIQINRLVIYAVPFTVDSKLISWSTIPIEFPCCCKTSENKIVPGISKISVNNYPFVVKIYTCKNDVKGKWTALNLSTNSFVDVIVTQSCYIKKILATKLSQQPLHILEEIYQASEVNIDLNVLKT